MNKVTLLATLVVAGATAQAAVVSVSGFDVRIFNPGNVAPGIVQSDFVNVFNEQQGVTLTTAMGLNHTATGLLNSPGSAVPGIIPFGVTVNSHFIHLDPAGGVTRTGSATFDGRIIGVIWDNPLFAASTPEVGLPGNVYGSATGAYGLEISPNEWIGISPDRLTLNFNWNAGNPGDRLRVITVVPEPGTALALAAGLLVVLRRRK